MKELFFTIVLMASVFAAGQVFANDCVTPDEVLGATYSLTVSNEEGVPTREHSITLLRQFSGRVIHRFEEEHITRVYENYGKGLIGVIEYFDLERIGVEYEPAQAAAGKNWNQLYELFSAEQVAELPVLDRGSYRCLGTSSYTSDDGALKVVTTLIDEVKLPLTLEQSSRQVHWLWKLQELHTDASMLERLIARIDSYTTYDFADLGDSEHEEFFRNSDYLNRTLHGTAGHAH